MRKGWTAGLVVRLAECGDGGASIVGSCQRLWRRRSHDAIGASIFCGTDESLFRHTLTGMTSLTGLVELKGILYAV
ncbi:hypothetical protein K458DRAFT_116287 [Lentithecium fluviatile CBS 122367]|uniref:Uncharacterized protein n=1 Tax=Lentithecium fluviatile CBS 122367 TaxID=1168545 RepID=A0A6G1IMH0_9PLEO|nr:hypothetical protein K458DRAFT_116287 [Lentithecium fluviatile CBS 122367]